MKSIHEYNNQELQWVHPNKFKGEYELRGGDEVFVRFHLNGASGSQIVAETADGNWIIKRKGFGQNVTIVAFDSQTELAAHDLPDLAMLTTTGWYLHKQQEEEATV